MKATDFLDRCGKAIDLVLVVGFSFVFAAQLYLQFSSLRGSQPLAGEVGPPKPTLLAKR